MTVVWTDTMDDVVRRFTYKPGWRIDFDPGPFTALEMGKGHVYPGAVLRVGFIGPDSRDPDGPERKLGFRLIVPQHLQDNALGPMHYVDWIMGQLLRIEKHERDEWARLDGELIRDPHANGRTRI